MNTKDILEIVYQIQGAADPAHPAGTRAERLDEIYELACDVMRQTGYRPDDPLPPPAEED